MRIVYSRMVCLDLKIKSDVLNFYFMLFGRLSVQKNSSDIRPQKF